MGLWLRPQHQESIQPYGDTSMGGGYNMRGKNPKITKKRWSSRDLHYNSKNPDPPRRDAVLEIPS